MLLGVQVDMCGKQKAPVPGPLFQIVGADQFSE